MEQAKELFGLFLLLAFMLIFPGMVSLCDCKASQVPRAIAKSSIAVFSGQIHTIEAQPVQFEDQIAVRTTYHVQSVKGWLFKGAQTAEYYLPRLNSADVCHETQNSYLFVVIGPANGSPYFWDCYARPSILLSR